MLIHGITGTPSEMNYLARHLQKAGFTVLCNSLPKHCGSLDELRRVSWEEIYDSVAADFQFLKQHCGKIFLCGLSMGATLCIHLSYNFPEEASGICALAPTLFYDGWNVTRKRRLMPIVWHTPLRYFLNVRETWPYGLKNELLRESIHRFYKNARVNYSKEKGALFGSPFIPVACLYQISRFNKIIMPEIPRVKTPIQIIHAQEDDMVSVKNAHYVYENIASSVKSLVILDDSYHMITIDKQKRKVADEAIRFFNKL